ncbi:MAG: SurA N-terminal domain-containing protein [Candidatus Omnitrophica bacterium]|nr:SurA N-terminal domain-containing protein [Candidatus Omnitrophota bacterium]
MKPRFLFLIPVLVLLTKIGYSEDHQLVDRIAAVVNNEVITQSEFDTIFRPIYEQIKKDYQGPNLQRELEIVRLKLLTQMIEDRLVYQEAEKLGLTVSETEIQEELSAFEKQFQKPETFEEELKKSGITLEDFKKRIRERIAITKFHQSMIRGKVLVSPTEVEEYYKGHPQEFNEKEQIKTWCITLRKSDEAIRKGIMDESVKKKAARLIEKLKRGEDFEKIAREHSEDSHAAEGGLMGFVQRGDMVGTIDQVLFSLSENSFSDILETETGYHIFKVGEKRAASHKTFEEAKDGIYENMFRTKAHKRFVSWMDELKKKSYISIR